MCIDLTLEADRAARAALETPMPHEMRLLCQLRDLLRDWPTDRALTASGAARATENKRRARAILAELDVPDLPNGWATPAPHGWNTITA